MKVLVSGFEPFLHHQTNPSQLVAKKLADIDNNITCITLPVSYERSFNLLKDKIEEIKPELIICLGLASERKTIDLERFALNKADAKTADNDQVIYENVTLNIAAPLALESSFPINDWIYHAQKNSWPVSISNHAGTYVCNCLLFMPLSTKRRWR
jgi:pyroglutamyl-peptidase